MATSGTYSFQPTNAQVVDEAFERIGVDPAEITARHIRSALFSMNLLFSEWHEKGETQWNIEQESQTLTQATVAYNLPTGGVDVLSMVHRKVTGSDNFDTPMYRISRADYLTIADKDIQGQPSQFFLDKAIGTPVITVWNSPQNSTDIILYNYIRRIQDAGAFADNPEIPATWSSAMSAGLAAKLYPKMHSAISGTYDINRETKLENTAAKSLRDAMNANRDRSPTRASVNFSGGRRR